jgi:hypothetical protein
MGLQTFTIELKLDAPDEHHEAMSQIAVQYARDMLASAMLLAPGKQPMVAVKMRDAFYDTREIEIMDPSEVIHGAGD